MNKLKNNRYLPFIIICVVLLLLLIVNVLTSKSKHVYTKNDIKFTYDSDTQSTVVENNVSSSTSNETQIEDTQSVENTQSSVEETYYEDTQAEEEQTSDEDFYEEPDTDTDLETDSETETKLFSSKEQLENIALGYLNQGRKYRKFFKNRELFEKRNEISIYDCSVKSSNLKNKTVVIKCRYDGDDNSFQTVKLQFNVENNKIIDVIVK